uniref:FCH domain-containing protein n=1 Tax=Oryzias melastigma TaxID=30732 RepID=A0A3B3DV40_ORYME
MQPPARKVRSCGQSEVNPNLELKLQTKHHQDTELLEEIRSFSKQRAAIEKEYGQVSLHWLF